jgi:hypothetical protein
MEGEAQGTGGRPAFLQSGSPSSISHLAALLILFPEIGQRTAVSSIEYLVDPKLDLRPRLSRD